METDLVEVGLGTLFTKNEPLLRSLNDHVVSSNYSLENPLVSICIISFNHRDYIRECLDSIFAQKTNFQFEVILGDDCSIDNTQENIKPYIDQYEGKIKFYFHPENLTQKYSEFTPGKLNFIHTLYNAKGKYIVFIEGDDYFTNDNKLQKQVDFLESNKDNSACFHNAIMKFENDNSLNYLINKPDQKTSILPADLLIEKETWFMATASVMFRRKHLSELKPWFGKSKSGDIPMYVLFSDKGPIGYLPDVMSVYRRHDMGLSFTDDRQHSPFVENRIFMFENLNRQTNGKYQSQINPILAEFYEMLASTVENQTSLFSRIKYISKSFMLSWPKDSSVTLERFRKIFRPEVQQLKNIFKA
jgi:glycosyltransferase involved in cell wall biosynthesis